MKAQELIQNLTHKLGNRFDAEYLLMSSFGITRAELYLDFARELSSLECDDLMTKVDLRLEGAPLQHVLGQAPFLDHVYRVNKNVLIPRPETEVLVTQVLKKIPQTARRGFELGLGSGIISIELCSARPELQMVATECSESALAVAKENAESILKHSSHRLKMILVNKMDRLEEIENLGQPPFDFIVSNPPYLAPSHHDEITDEVLKFEPDSALFPPTEDPLWFYRAFATTGKRWLVSGGPIFVEIPHERVSEIKLLFEQQGWDIQVTLDLNSRPRVLEASYG